MMTLAQLLPDFGTVEGSDNVSLEISDVALEDQRLEAFEKGYSAGWDDAIAAQSNDQTRIKDDFARNLNDLSFTYHDAQAGLTKSLGPFLAQIVNTVLPELAKATLGAHVVEHLSSMGVDAAEQPVEIVVAPQNAQALEGILNEDLTMPVKVLEEDTLGEGQVYMRLGASERELNLDAALAEINEAVQAFLHKSQEHHSHG